MKECFRACVPGGIQHLLWKSVSENKRGETDSSSSANGTVSWQGVWPVRVRHRICSSGQRVCDGNKTVDISGWVTDAAGTHAAGWGLTLTAMDMAKIGQLYLNGGIWEGRQIISAEWIAESTAEHSRWQKRNLPYGYLWWVTEDGYAAMGDGGNVIYANTKKKLAAEKHHKKYSFKTGLR